MLAMHRIGFMPIEAAGWAVVFKFGWLEYGLRQTHEQGDAEDHDEHAQDFAAGRGQGDITEASGGESGYGEVEGVHVVGDAGFVLSAQHKH